MYPDFRAGLRFLTRHPGFTAVGVLTLGLGIGVNAAFFSLINAALLRPLAVTDSDQLVNVYMTQADGSGYGALSYPDYRDLADSVEAFGDVLGYSGLFATVTGDGPAETVFGELVTGNYFSLLGVTPALGRGFLPDEDRTPGTHPVVVLGHAYWMRRFGGDPGAVGRTLSLNGRPYTVVGVAPREFGGLLVRGLRADLWAPVMMMGQLRTDQLANRNERWLFVKGRLTPSASLASATAQADTIALRLEQLNPQSNDGRRLHLLPTDDVLISPEGDRIIGPMAVVLLAAAGLVMVVACTNLAGLLLARTASRRREMAVRVALGATRGRIVGQLLVENGALALAGAAAGLVIAYWIAALLVAFRPPLPVPIALDVPIDGRVLAYTACLGIVSALVLAWFAAVSVSGSSLVPAIKGDQPRGARLGRGRLGSALLVPQVSISLVLLLVAMLFARSVSRAATVDPGFDVDGTALVAVNLQMSGYDEPRARQFLDQFVRRVEGRPGVRAAAVTDRIPLDLYGSQSATLALEDDSLVTTVQVARVSAGYFEALGIELLQGRAFAAADVASGAPVAVVSAEAARRYWPNQNAVGRRLRLGGTSQPWLEVVGVAHDTKVQSLGESPQPFVYRPLADGHADLLRIVVGLEGDPRQAVRLLRADVQALDSDVAVFDSSTMEDAIGLMLYPFRLAALVGSALGLFVLGLAAVGLYGLVSFAVARRTHELAIRMALGARPGSVVRLVMRDGLMAAGVGLAIGLAGALALTPLVAAWVFGVSALDAVSYAAAVGALVAAVLVASYLPARRAVRRDPIVALRQD